MRPRRHHVTVLALLLPPSEGKAPGGRRPPWRPGSGRLGRRLGRHRSAVVEALAAVDGGDQRLLGARGETLERARRANLALPDAPTLPAAERFTGVVWEHLGVATLPPEARRRADDAVLVVSALLGASALGDPVPDFRLKLSVSLGELGRLDRWWRPRLTPVLADALEDRLVIDLLPQEHRAALEVADLRCDLRRVHLVDATGRTAGHGAKAAKGHLARALLCADDPEAVLAAGHIGDHGIVVETPSTA